VHELIDSAYPNDVSMRFIGKLIKTRKGGVVCKSQGATAKYDHTTYTHITTTDQQHSHQMLLEEGIALIDDITRLFYQKAWQVFVV